VLQREGRIDMLKIDTEGLENRTVGAIEPDVFRQVGVLCFEARMPMNPAPERLELRYATETARLTNRGVARAQASADARSPAAAERPA
jgi:hypothetical protein